MTTSSRLDCFTAALNDRGLDAAVKVLNDGVPHRYTAVYALEAGILRNVALFDKKGEVTPEFLLEVPLDISFCQFVIRDGAFRTNNSADDRRLDGHPYQGVMVCYHGVPLVDASGDICGTLCHFDIDELTLTDEEFGLLQKAARSLPRFISTISRP